MRAGDKAATVKRANGRAVPPTWRRQLNDGFQNPDGSFSWSKSFTAAGQASCLYHLNYHFAELMERWDSLALILSVLVAPELLKKLLSMKYGGSPK